MQPSVILPAAVEKRPDDGRGSGNHKHAEGHDPTEHAVEGAAVAAEGRGWGRIHVENMGADPGDHGAQRPDSGRIGQIGCHLGSVEQADDDLRGKTIQPQIYHPESKGNPEGQVPPRNVGPGLDRFGPGLWNRLKLSVLLRSPSYT